MSSCSSLHPGDSFCSLPRSPMSRSAISHWDLALRRTQHQSGVTLVSPSAPYKLWFALQRCLSRRLLQGGASLIICRNDRTGVLFLSRVREIKLEEKNIWLNFSSTAAVNPWRRMNITGWIYRIMAAWYLKTYLAIILTDITISIWLMISGNEHFSHHDFHFHWKDY